MASESQSNVAKESDLNKTPGLGISEEVGDDGKSKKYTNQNQKQRESFLTYLDEHANVHQVISEEGSASSSSSSSSGPSYKEDWNALFQFWLEQPDSPEKFGGLNTVASDFVATARAYAQIIIREYYLPKGVGALFTAKDAGGIAGGKKFVARGIFFKLSDDISVGGGSYVYGGRTPNYELAAKAAGHELKGTINGLQACLLARTSSSLSPSPPLSLEPRARKVTCSMMCVIDCLGLRMVAMPLLPLKNRATDSASNPNSNVNTNNPSSSEIVEVENVYDECDRYNVRDSDGEGYIEKNIDNNNYNEKEEEEMGEGIGSTDRSSAPGKGKGEEEEEGEKELVMLYGSSDGGRTVHCYPPFHHTMEVVAKELHLAPHLVDGKLLCTAGDVEGQRGSDGRDYLLDMARLFPPEAKHLTPHLPSRPQSIFFRLLRPELLLKLKYSGHPALSADTWSGWAYNQRDTADHQKNNELATNYLIKTVIPDLAKRLSGGEKINDNVNDNAVVVVVGGKDENSNKSTPNDVVLTFPFSPLLHREGVNVRHLGYLRSLIPSTTAHCIRVRELLMVEMVARACKNQLRSLLRAAVQRRTSEAHIQDVIANFLNGVTTARISRVWDEIRGGVEDRFGACALEGLDPEPDPDNPTAPPATTTTTNVKVVGVNKREGLVDHMREYVEIIIRYACRGAGIELAGECAHLAVGHAFFFTRPDVVLSARVKEFDRTDFSAAIVLLDQAQSKGVPRTAAGRLYRLSELKFKSCLHSSPINWEASYLCTKTQMLPLEDRQEYADSDQILLTALSNGDSFARVTLTKTRGFNEIPPPPSAAAAYANTNANNNNMQESHLCIDCKCNCSSKKKTEYISDPVINDGGAGGGGGGGGGGKKKQQDNSPAKSSWFDSDYDGHAKGLVVTFGSHHPQFQQNVLTAAVEMWKSRAQQQLNRPNQSRGGRAQCYGAVQPDTIFKLFKFPAFIPLFKDLAQSPWFNTGGLLTAAGTVGCTQAIQALLQIGVSPDVCNPRTKATAVMTSSGGGHVEIVNLLLQHKAELNLRDQFKRTALFHAAQSGREDCARLLLSLKADPLASSSNGTNSLMAACESLHAGCVDVIAAAVATLPYPVQEQELDLNSGSYYEPSLPTTTTTTTQNIQPTATMLEKRDMFGRTCAIRAVLSASHAVLKVLLNQKANPTGIAMASPLVTAVELGDIEAVKILREAGADPSILPVEQWKERAGGNTVILEHLGV